MADTNNDVKQYGWNYFKDIPVSGSKEEGFSWTDSNGNKNKLYPGTDNKNRLYHSITNANGEETIWDDTPVNSNYYIPILWNRAKSASKKQAKANTKPSVNVNTNSSPITNSITEVSNSMSKTPENDTNAKSFSEEPEKEVPQQPRTTTPEENESESIEETNPEKNNGDENKKGSKERIDEEVENTRRLLHDPDNYKDNYQAIIDTAGKRGIAEDMLSGSEGKEKGIYGPTTALINGEFGNYHLPKHETTKRYKLRDSITGEVIDDGQGATANELKKLNETIAQDRKERGWTFVNGRDGGFDVIDMKGNVIEHFDNEKDAKKYLNGWFELSDDVASESHYVSYNDKKTRYDTKEEAEQAKKELSKATRGDRRNAWAQYLTHLGSGLGKGALDFLANAASWAASGQLVGDKFTGPSTWDKELNKRVEGNNELYYKNEEAKNDVVRKLISMADSGMIDLNNLTNEQMATFIGTIGKENATQIINTIRKQELDKFMALDYWKNWDEDQRNALSAWFAQSGQGPQTESMIALASGKVKPKDYANKWNAETRLALAQQGLDLQRIEKAIEDATLKNKMTSAQADVIKELVGEQLKAAKLGNNAKAVEIATSSVDSLSKIIDAVVPF